MTVSQETLAEATGTSVATIRRHTQELEAMRATLRIRVGPGTYAYRLDPEETWRYWGNAKKFAAFNTKSGLEEGQRRRGAPDEDALRHAGRGGLGQPPRRSRSFDQGSARHAEALRLLIEPGHDLCGKSTFTRFTSIAWPARRAPIDRPDTSSPSSNRLSSSAAFIALHLLWPGAADRRSAAQRLPRGVQMAVQCLPPIFPTETNRVVLGLRRGLQEPRIGPQGLRLLEIEAVLGPYWSRSCPGRIRTPWEVLRWAPLNGRNYLLRQY